jgi:hypothetical protein
MTRDIVPELRVLDGNKWAQQRFKMSLLIGSREFESDMRLAHVSALSLILHAALEPGRV